MVHDLPADLKKALISDAKALQTWDITPLAAMNGFAGWSSAKKARTELAGLNGAVLASKRESGDRVVGLAVDIVEIIAVHVLRCTHYRLWGLPGTCDRAS